MVWQISKIASNWRQTWRRSNPEIAKASRASLFLEKNNTYKGDIYSHRKKSL